MVTTLIAIRNDSERWPEFFNEYHGAKVLSYDRHERFAKIDFQLTNEEGENWQSWRMLDFQENQHHFKEVLEHQFGEATNAQK